MATKRAPRTDIHRPGAIVPAHYEQWLDYSRGHGTVRSIGVDCATPYDTYDDEGRRTGTVHPECPDTGRCCARSAERAAAAEGREVFGATGKCGVCGARYTYGTLYRHEGGALVHMGHDCAEKYALLADRSAWELAHDRAVAAAAVQVERAERAERRTSFLVANPGLEEALALGAGAEGGEAKARARGILADMAARFVTYCSLSAKQVEYALKLAAEIKAPPVVRPEEKHVAAPTGRVDFEGEIVSVKEAASDFGLCYKMTIRVNTAAGSWLAWCTMPASIRDEIEQAGAALSSVRGRRVALRATLAPGRESHFAFGARPSGHLLAAA